MDPTIAAERRRAEEEAADFFRVAPPLRDRDSTAASVADFVARYSRRSTGKSSSPNSPDGLRPELSLPSSPTNATQQRGPEEGLSGWSASLTGGTTVPLEQRCVRSIDNFSSGQRGAASTEYFLKAGYPVIFIHRRGSKQPYCRFLPEDSFLDCFQLGEESEIQVTESHTTVVKAAISNYRKAIDEGQLLKLPFTTIFEYLQVAQQFTTSWLQYLAGIILRINWELLQMVSTAMNGLEHNGMFYLAAAVSDFYVPWESMAKHKIQSACGPLNMQLSQVPKMLFILRNHWAPSAFCVSFKLETDPDILLQKAEMALRKYGMNVVVANELANYKDVVVMVTSSGRTTVSRPSKEDDVEEQLVDLLVKMHSDRIVRPNSDREE